MGDSLTINTQFGEVVVRKMPLADYAELLRALDKIPQSLTGFIDKLDKDQVDKMSNTEYVLLLPSLLAEAWADLIAVVAVPTDKDAEFMAKLDLADAVDIVEGILELNDVQRIIAAVKKMLALKTKVVQPTATSST